MKAFIKILPVNKLMMIRKNHKYTVI